MYICLSLSYVLVDFEERIFLSIFFSSFLFHLWCSTSSSSFYFQIFLFFFLCSSSFCLLLLSLFLFLSSIVTEFLPFVIMKVFLFPLILTKFKAINFILSHGIDRNRFQTIISLKLGFVSPFFFSFCHCNKWCYFISCLKFIFKIN